MTSFNSRLDLNHDTENRHLPSASFEPALKQRLAIVSSATSCPPRDIPPAQTWMPPPRRTKPSPRRPLPPIIPILGPETPQLNPPSLCHSVVGKATSRPPPPRPSLSRITAILNKYSTRQHRSRCDSYPSPYLTALRTRTWTIGEWLRISGVSDIWLADQIGLFPLALLPLTVAGALGLLRLRRGRTLGRLRRLRL